MKKQHHRKRGFAAIAAAALTLGALLCSCARQEAAYSGSELTEVALGPFVSVAGLPAPGRLDTLRRSAGLTETLVQGKFTLLRSSGAVDNGTALDLPSGTGMEWGLYGFDPQGTAPDSVSVALDVTPGDSAWIGLADYAAGVWEWHGPLAAAKTLAIDEARYLSPGGLLYCTVAASAGDSATVNALSIRTINPQNVAPTADLQASVSSGDAPLSVDFDASGSSDSDGMIVEYAWDFDANGTYEEFSDAPVVSHIFTNPGIYTVRMRVSDEQFARANDTQDITVNVAGNDPPVGAFVTVPDANEAVVYEPMNFDASTSSDSDGSIVRYDWDFDGDGSWDGYDSAAVVDHTYLITGSFDARLRVTDNRGAQNMFAQNIEVSPPGGSGPVADFSPSPVAGIAPLDVDFDASVSLDDDGSIGLYEWDWDGDGSYDSESSSPLASHTYAGPRQYSAFLRVTDNNGNQGTTSRNISVYLNPQVVGDAGTGVNGISLQAVVGAPAWAYYNNVDTCLYYRRSLNEAGTDLNDVVLVDDSADVGKYPSMVIVNGNPAVAYLDITNSQLMFCRASGIAGGAWDPPVVADTGVDNDPLSLVVVNGMPAVGYSKTGDMMYVQATNASGSAWGAPAVAALASNATPAGLAVVNGNPALAYWDATSSEFWYVRSNDANGVAWGSPVLIDDSGTAGIGGHLAVATGVPVIAYCIQSLGQLRFAQGTDSDGVNWAAPSILDADGNCGQHAWLTLIGGVPAISYSKDGDLSYIRANSTALTSWSDPVVLNPSFGPYYSQILEINGNLAISAQQSVTGEVLYFWGF